MMEDLNQRDAERRRYEECNEAQMGGEPVLPSYIRRQEREEYQKHVREWEQSHKAKDPALPRASELQLPPRDRESPSIDQEKRPSD